MAERIEQYLDEVGAQVRWKRVRPALTQELRTHLEEQAEAYRAEGLPAAEAEAEAVRQMGDAEQIGLALDAVHRPKRQTAILSLAGICILLGAIFRILSQDSPKLFTLAGPVLTYGISGKADLFARDIEITETGVSFTLNLRNLHAERVHLLLTGMFNVYNALAAAACALILGVELDAIKRGLEAVVSVPGRVEMLPTKTPYRMILDYSHSPDALENILKTVREFCHGRIILVFGCGGDRDKGKRPMMGEIAGRLADYAILTSDNPRFEDPMAILAAIEAGIKPTGAKYEVIENRREAIRQAMEMAVSGDIVVLAGKGHETYQEIRGVKHPFDEKVIVSELLEEIAGENRAE